MKFRKPKIEDPIRIDFFLDSIKKIDWNGNDEVKSKNFLVLYNAIFSLVKTEIDYYYKKRKQRKLISKILKIGMFTFSSLGFIVPFIAAIKQAPWEVDASIGYFFFGLAIISFSLDKFTNTSNDYIRNVSTQYQLEKILVIFSVTFYEFLEKISSSSPHIDKKSEFKDFFKVINGFLETFYLIINKETETWILETRQALKKFEELLDKQKPA